ncbi:MAG: phage holin family protein [Pseudopedobacter sp.]|nr:phage holin family protein [Deinococcales bacterium]
MATENKSIGGVLVEIFDSALSLVKIESRSFIGKISNIIKAKGLGVVLLLAALGPIGVAVVFLLIGFYQVLIALQLPDWGASFVMFAVSLLVAGILAFIGIKRLGAKTDG